jgi:hypothetical protein
MSRAQFMRRLCVLEAQSQPDTADGWTPPVFPDDWYEEVLRLLEEYGYLEAVLHSLASFPQEEHEVCGKP